jgi:hypothetical protein
MTRVVPFTQAGLRRAIEAARKAGLRVTAIRPDGTIETTEKESSQETRASLEPKPEIVL